MMTFEAENFLACLDVPQLSGVVHGASGDEHTVRVEREADDLHLVAFECMVELTSVRIPNLCFAIERARDNLVSVT